MNTPKEYFVTKADRRLVIRHLKKLYKESPNALCISEISYEDLSPETKQNIADYYGVQPQDMEFSCSARKLIILWKQHGIDFTLKENGVTARQGVTIIPEKDRFLYGIYRLYLSRRSSYLYRSGWGII